MMATIMQQIIGDEQEVVDAHEHSPYCRCEPEWKKLCQSCDADGCCLCEDGLIDASEYDISPDSKETCIIIHRDVDLRNKP